MELPEGAISYGARITQLAELYPDTVALVFAADDGTERAFTHRELDRRAVGVAQLLARDGLGEGDMLVVALPNCPEHVLATLGAWKLGATVVPLRHDLPDWELERVLDIARPKVVVDARGAIAAVAPSEARLPDRIAHPAMAVASGGATGRPKLIVTPTPGAAVPGLASTTTASPYPGGAGHVQLITAPLYHTNGFAICHNGLFEDQRVVLMEHFDAARAVDLIERHHVTVMTMAPTMLLRIARLPDIDARDLSSIQGILQGAASCPQWLVRRWIELVGAEHFFIAYGSTERVGLAMIRGDDWLEHPGSVGRGFNADIRILDDAGRELPPGEIGEIFMRSQVTLGAPTYEYIGASPARRTDDGFTSIGDLGRLDADGYLYIADRRVDLIVTGGANVFPAEVEAALSEHPRVGDVAVIGRPDEEWGQRVVAVVEPVDVDDPPTVADLEAHCRARLARYKVPRVYEIVDRLPRTPAGKLNRSALVPGASRQSTP